MRHLAGITTSLLLFCSLAFGQRGMVQAQNTLQLHNTAVLDTFNRANENPLSDSGKWTNNVVGTGTCQILSLAVQGIGGAGCDAKWNPNTFTKNWEVYMNISTLPSSGNDIGVLGYDSSINGYLVDLLVGTNITISSIAAGVPGSAICTATTSLPTTGDVFGMTHTGTTDVIWKVHSGVQTQLCITSDTTVTPNAANIGVLMDITGAGQNFGGGSE